MKKLYIGFIIYLIAVPLGIQFFGSRIVTKKAAIVIPKTVMVIPTQTPTLIPPATPTPILEPSLAGTNVFDLFVSSDSAHKIIWTSAPQATNSAIGYTDSKNVTVETVPGIHRKGYFIASKSAYAVNPNIGHEIENAEYLQHYGYLVADRTGASGPTGDVWAYARPIGEQTSLIMYSYFDVNARGTAPRIACPCKFTVDVFHSEPFVVPSK